MLDITLSSPECRDALLDVFFKQCNDLMPNISNRKVAKGINIVTVTRMYDIDFTKKIFDVVMAVNGEIKESNVHCGIDGSELETTVKKMLMV